MAENNLTPEEPKAASSVVVEDKKNKVGKTAMVVIALASILAIAYLKYNQQTAKPIAANDAIAGHKKVEKLKPLVVETASVPAVEVKDTPAAAYDRNAERQAELERMRKAQELKMHEARLKSAIIAQGSDLSPTASSPEAQQKAGGLLGGEHGAQDKNSAFARSVSGQGVTTSAASQLKQLEYKILQGKSIDAVLEPRAISDLPSMICATVDHDVYGAQGRIKLIPWGSRVCGTYSADISKGQSRLFTVWNTLRRPDGVQVTLDSIGSDQMGTAGIGGQVDAHFAQIFGMSALLSIIGAGSSNAGVNPADNSNSASYYRQSVQQSFAQSSQQALAPYNKIPPTITVPAGSRIRIYVNRDLDFSPIYQSEIAAEKNNGNVTMFIN